MAVVLDPLPHIVAVGGLSCFLLTPTWVTWLRCQWRPIWRREDVQMSLERECVKDTDVQLSKTAGQGIAGV